MAGSEGQGGREEVSLGTMKKRAAAGAKGRLWEQALAREFSRFRVTFGDLYN